MADTVTGDNEYSFYRSGPSLVDFLNDFGFNDTYGQGFPSRWSFADDKIREIVQQGRLVEFINFCLDEARYFETHEEKYQTQDKIVELWNKYLEVDKLQIIRNGNRYHLKDLETAKLS